MVSRDRPNERKPLARKTTGNPPYAPYFRADRSPRSQASYCAPTHGHLTDRPNTAIVAWSLTAFGFLTILCKSRVFNASRKLMTPANRWTTSHAFMSPATDRQPNFYRQTSLKVISTALVRAIHYHHILFALLRYKSLMASTRYKRLNRALDDDNKKQLVIHLIFINQKLYI